MNANRVKAIEPCLVALEESISIFEHYGPDTLIKNSVTLPLLQHCRDMIGILLESVYVDGDESSV